MAIYPAIFQPREQGGYTVEFPDLPGCFTEGHTEQEAMEMARDALSGHVHALHDLGREVPFPSVPSSLKTPVGAFLALVEGPAEETHPVRINVSIDKALLRRIDAIARREGMTRSGMLAASARRYMAQGESGSNISMVSP